MTQKADSALAYIVVLVATALAAVAISNAPDIRIARPNLSAGSWYLQQVAPWPDFIAPAAATVGPDTKIYFSPEELPPPPDCRELGVEECRWEANWLETPGGNMVQLELKASDGRVVGRVELLKVQTAEFPELQQLARIGYGEGWIARIEVLNVLRGNGIGRVMWQAGDAILRVVSGGGALRVFADQAGWGPAIMKYVDSAAFVMRQAPVWAYIVE